MVCDEIVHMIKPILSGIRITDDTLALDVIRDVGPGGSFFYQEHTVRQFRTELFFPVFFRRQPIDQWRQRGAKPIVDSAHARVQEILAKAGPVPLPKGSDVALESALRGALREEEQALPQRRSYGIRARLAPRGSRSPAGDECG